MVLDARTCNRSDIRRHLGHGKGEPLQSEVARSETRPSGEGISCAPTPASDDLKRCTKCGEPKPRAEFNRDRSR
jgi:hypothetical protein